jgi:hypothetical protein
MFEKKFAKKVRKYYKLSEGRGGEGRREGGEGGELSFQCLRPSTSLMAAGKNSFDKKYCIPLSSYHNSHPAHFSQVSSSHTILSMTITKY